MAASREHQGLIISLIIFVMLTVMMSVTAYVLYSRDEEANAKVEAAKENEKIWQKKADDNQANLNEMKGLLGFSDADTLKAIKDKWKEDMAVYKDVYKDGDELNYSKLIGFLAAEIRQQDDQRKIRMEKVAQYDLDLVAAQTGHKTVITEVNAKFKLATDDLAGRTATFATSVQDIQRKVGAAFKRFEEDQQTATAAARLTSAQLAQINEDFQREQRKRKSIQNKLNDRDRIETEVADGKITSISTTTGRIYLNVGRSDGLRPQVTFSVHGQNVANVAKARPKASIIVTRLLSDPHMAEARVVDEDIANPIIRGDRIFSPAWSPGRTIHFAFAGTIDMDGDGRSDMKRLRDLVAVNNGIVDAWPDENGDMEGKIDTNTRYLVVGKAKLKNAAAIESRSTAIDKARENGVQQLSVTEFLDMMGWKNPRRTVRIGRGAKGSDFSPRRPAPKSTGNVNDFKPRRP
jgi:hypothetical protein